MPKNSSNLKKHIKRIFDEYNSIILLLLGLLTGCVIGLAFKLTSFENKELFLWFKLPGLLYMRIKQLLVLPCVFFSVLTATSTLELKKNCKLCISCILISLFCIIFSLLIGLLGSLLFMLIINRTNETSSASSQKNIENYRTIYDIIADFLRNLISNNIFKALQYQEFTQYTIQNTTGDNQTTPEIVNLAYTNQIGILFFTIIMGVATASIKENGQPVYILVKSLNEIFMKIFRWVGKLSPIGLGSLLFGAIISINDFKNELKNIWIFAGIVVLTCLFYSFCFQSLLVFLITRTNPFKYFSMFFDAILTTFIAANSAICVNKGIEISEEKCKIDPTISKFTIPFFTISKLDGSALFMVIASVFLTHEYNYILNFKEYALIVLITFVNSFSVKPG